jgi:hypothetical protein
MAKRPEPTFEVRFVGSGIVPERIPLRAISDALGAIQDLASGRDPFETSHVPQSKSIGLIKVRRGSAVYSCVARAPDEARANLGQVGRILAAPDESEVDGNIIIAALRPLETLSTIARSIKCRVEVIGLNGGPETLVVIEKDAFDKISGKHLMSGDTTVVGTVERVGGATEMRCSMQVPGRHRLLYCDVGTKELVQRLGQHLYEEIAAVGTAVWINRLWRIYTFKIRDFTQPKMGNPTKAIAKLREAGLKAWDDIADPEAYIREIGS